jgi:hypothetical protein
MPVATVTVTATCLGTTVTRAVTVTEDGAVIKDPELPAAKDGTLTTRTNDTSGTLTMAASHGITTGARLDLYWTGGSRYGITVGTVATNAVPISGGAGDNLPAEDAEITAMVPVLETFVVTGADLEFLQVGSAAPQATAVFREADTTLVLAVNTDGSRAGYVWESTNNVTNPFAENVADVYLSHSDSANPRRVSAFALVN